MLLSWLCPPISLQISKRAGSLLSAWVVWVLPTCS